MLRRLTGFFLRLGAAHVFDTSDSRDFSLLETAAEFVARYREGHPAGGPHAGASPPPHCSASISLLLYAQHQNRRISRHQQRNPATDRHQSSAAGRERPGPEWGRVGGVSRWGGGRQVWWRRSSPLYRTAHAGLRLPRLGVLRGEDARQGGAAKHQHCQEPAGRCP